MEQGDVAKAQAYYRDNLKLAPTRWKSYSDVAWLLFVAGDVNAAAKMFHSYGGFKKGAPKTAGLPPRTLLMRPGRIFTGRVISTLPGRSNGRVSEVGVVRRNH